MKKQPDFTGQLRAAADQPLPATKSDAWNTAAPGAVVQRDLTRPLAGAAREVNLDAIRPDPRQPRKTMSAESLEELANSIRDVGVLQPVTVAWADEQQVYLLITGHRRYEAALKAGLQSIPAIIRPTSPAGEQRLLEQLVENLHRENIPPLEEAQAIKALIEVGNLTQRQAARKLNKPLTYVNEALSLLKLPASIIKVAMDRGIAKSALIKIAGADSAEQQEAEFQAALASPHPYRAIAERRARGTTNRLHASRRFRRNFRVAQLEATIIVRFDRHPDEVSDPDVLEALRVVASTLEANDELPPDKP